MSLGPLTTTFTPPADCTASSALYWINTANTFYWLHGQPAQSSCFPEDYSPYQNQYYSPGICPTGYTRACEVTTGRTTQATCCPQGNYVCAPTSSSYSYVWGPTLGCMSVYRVDTRTSFTTINDTLKGFETAGTPMNIRAPGTIMAYGVVIRNTPATTTQEESTSTSTSESSSMTITSGLTSETISTTTDAAAAGETQPGSTSSGGGLSTGAAAGIGVATTFVIVAIGGAIIWLFWTRRRKRKQWEAEDTARAAMSPGSWSESTWGAPTHYPQQQAVVQMNWQPTELGVQREPKEMSAEVRVPVETDGRGLYGR